MVLNHVSFLDRPRISLLYTTIIYKTTFYYNKIVERYEEEKRFVRTGDDTRADSDFRITAQYTLYTII